MLYLVDIEMEKISGSMKNDGRWSDILDEMFPEMVLFSNGLGILQNILSINVLLFIQTL